MTERRSIAAGVLGTLILLVLVIAFLFLAIRFSHAHDSWISRNGYRSWNGTWCCGDNDCFAVEAAEVPGGYKLADTGEFVPTWQVQPSRDNQYWRCHTLLNGVKKVRCFFAPLSSMLETPMTDHG